MRICGMPDAYWRPALRYWDWKFHYSDHHGFDWMPPWFTDAWYKRPGGLHFWDV